MVFFFSESCPDEQTRGGTEAATAPCEHHTDGEVESDGPEHDQCLLGGRLRTRLCHFRGSGSQANLLGSAAAVEEPRREAFGSHQGIE